LRVDGRVFLTPKRHRGNKERPAGRVSARRRLRGLRVDRDTQQHRRSNGFSAAVSVVRSIASSVATLRWWAAPAG